MNTPLVVGIAHRPVVSSRLTRPGQGRFRKTLQACHGKGANEGGMNHFFNVHKLLAGKQIVFGDGKGSKIYVRMTKENNPMPPDEDSNGKVNTVLTDDRYHQARIDAGAPDFNPKVPRVPSSSTRKFWRASTKTCSWADKDDREYQSTESLQTAHLPPQPVLRNRQRSSGRNAQPMWEGRGR
ncbi:MAG: hypothetical protein EXS09_09815 [Gemmataceae bacterium]|nr:hypothetical protein [Gemmataceae bacterium]